MTLSPTGEKRLRAALERESVNARFWQVASDRKAAELERQHAALQQSEGYRANLAKQIDELRRDLNEEKIRTSRYADEISLVTARYKNMVQQAEDLAARNAKLREFIGRVAEGI